MRSSRRTRFSSISNGMLLMTTRWPPRLLIVYTGPLEVAGLAGIVGILPRRGRLNQGCVEPGDQNSQTIETVGVRPFQDFISRSTSTDPFGLVEKLKSSPQHSLFRPAILRTSRSDRKSVV